MVGVVGGLLAALLWPLYARIPHDQALLHPRRAALAELIRAEPGIHHEAILRKLPMGRGTLEHHLGKLVAARILVASPGPRYTCYFVRDGTDRHVINASALLKAHGARRVLASVVARPCSAPEIVAATGLKRQTVWYHLERLQGADIVRRDTAGGLPSFSATGAGISMARSWAEA